MSFSWISLWLQDWPLAILLGAALVCMLTSVLRDKAAYAITAGLSSLALAVAAYGFCTLARHGEPASFPFLTFDAYSRWISSILASVGLVTSLVSYRYMKNQEERIGEYYSLLLFGVAGMSLMVSTTNLLAFVLALEIMSLGLYAMVGLRRFELVSSESSVKYFLLGSVATAFLLFGISLFYGATGSLDIGVLGGEKISKDLLGIFQWGAILILLGFIFKVAAAPFQFWAPDVYDGAPMPVTGFMATGVKVAAFGALIRVMQGFLKSEVELPWAHWFAFLSILTLVVGNTAALRQHALKRILAYSSISHAGYLLLGFVPLVQGNVFHPEALTPLLFYFLSYSLLTLGVFAVLTALSSGGEEFSTLDHLDGLAERHPVLSALLSLFLISLAGIPPTAGFFAKYLLFGQVIRAGAYPLAIVGILMSAVSLFYYLAPIVRMYFRGGEKSYPIPHLAWVMRALLLILTLGVFYFGLFPGGLLGEIKTLEPQGNQSFSSR